MVSLTTILRTSAEEAEWRTRTATRLRRIRGIGLAFIGPLPPPTIFLLLFVTDGGHFFGFASAGISVRSDTPAGKTGAAGDQPSAALVGEIRPCPLDEDQHAVLEPNQKKNVNEEPGQPRDESRDVNLSELRNCGGAADGGEATFIVVVKWWPGRGFRFA